MFKNVASQKWVVFAFNTTDGTPQSSDEGQITAKIAKDGAAAAATNDVNPTEIEDGYYAFDLTQAETNADTIHLLPESASSNIQVIGVPGVIFTDPQYFPDMGIESDGDLTKVNQLADAAIGAATFASGAIDAAAIGTGAIDADAIAGDAITAAAIAADAITAAKIAADAIGASEMADDGSVQIAAAVWDRLLSGATHNIATSAGRRLRAIQDYSDYDGGAVWIDTVNGTAGTTDFENGTVSLPVDSIADALTIAASVGLTRLRLLPGSSITFAATMDGYELVGMGWTLALGGQSCSGTIIHGATVSGVCTGANAPEFINCKIGTVTVPACRLIACQFTGDITMSAAGDYFWDQCYSGVAGTATPSTDFGGAVANTNLSMRHYSGGIEIKNMGGAGTDTMSLEGFGQLVINANCSGGTVAIRGNFTVTDNASAAVTLSDDARVDQAQILGAVVDDATQIDASQLNTHTAITPASAAEIAAVQTEVDKIGTIPALDGAAQEIGAALGKLADDNAGADFDAATDSLNIIAAAAAPAAAWDAVGASHNIEDTFGNIINDLVQENGGTGVYEYKTTALANAPSGTGQTQYFVLGGANQDDENLITWHAYCLKNGAPVAGTNCVVQLYKDDGDGTITEVTGATDTVASPDANYVFNESMEVALIAGGLYYYKVTMTVDAATRTGFITLQVPERTAS